ncbi:uncharacterized protein LOC17889560 [Capsella rubella]|uniref:uncharacterized protein LOC17889560 n=1 Tax=Capsella rubella TaxID=81985 RepID=UPI000CD53AAD|nr:uncharacterized protein LOC17889560 [Capsella rubella]
MADGEDNANNGGGREVAMGRRFGICVGNNNNTWMCTFCYNVCNGGITRLKQHLVGGFRNATKCKHVQDWVEKLLRDYKMKKEAQKQARNMDHQPEVGADDEYDEGEPSASALLSKKRKIKGPLDKYVTIPPRDVLQGRKERKCIFGACDKEQRNIVCLGIARWFYDAGLSFNAVTYPSWNEMCELIGLYGPGLKTPSMWEVREPLLKREKANVGAKLLKNKKEWSNKGCSLMSNGWRDPVSKKDIVKFLVNSTKGSVFLKSMDVSEVVKDARLLFELLYKMVKEVREHNVVQVVTDNASNYIKAGKYLMDERRHLYWTPCAAHCIDLMLEDIASLLAVKNAMKKCMFMNNFIYGRVPIVNMMRRFTSNRNLHRPVITRFATSFITMSQFHK